MKKICMLIGMSVFYFITSGLYAEESVLTEGTETTQDSVQQPEQKIDQPLVDQAQEEKTTDKDALKGTKEAQEVKEVKETKENKEASLDVEEETEEVEEPVIYKKEGDIGLRFRFAWGATRLDTEMDYYGKSVQTKAKTVDDAANNKNLDSSNTNSTFYATDSDPYLGIANFMFSVTYRPVDLPLDIGFTFMLERFKESYPLYFRADSRVISKSGNTTVTEDESAASDDSYTVKTKMQKLSLDIMYSFPEFIVTPYVALNIYPWYNTKIKGFEYKGQDWLIDEKGDIKADSDIGYGCTVGINYNILERLSVFMQLSFEKSVSKINLTNRSSQKDTDGKAIYTSKSTRFELEHKITKIMLGVGSSI